MLMLTSRIEEHRDRHALASTCRYCRFHAGPEACDKTNDISRRHCWRPVPEHGTRCLIDKIAHMAYTTCRQFVLVIGWLGGTSPWGTDAGLCS
jgi:hypothetical protein